MIIIIFLILLILILIIYKKYYNILENLNFSSNKYKYGIVLCCYNRYDYLKKTLNSLKESNINNCLVCIINDCSTDNRIEELINNFNINNKNDRNIKIEIYKNNKNVNIAKSLLRGFNTIYYKCEYMLNIDSDVIMKKDWLNILMETYNSFNKNNNNSVDTIVTGFNCVNSCAHKIIDTYDNYYIKKSIGGINMFFNKKLYKDFIKNILENNNNNWDWKIVHYCNKNNIKLIATKPSVIQHIGVKGMNSRNKRVDIAEDF